MRRTETSLLRERVSEFFRRMRLQLHCTRPGSVPTACLVSTLRRPSRLSLSPTAGLRHSRSAWTCIRDPLRPKVFARASVDRPPGVCRRACPAIDEDAACVYELREQLVVTGRFEVNGRSRRGTGNSHLARSSSACCRVNPVRRPAASVIGQV